MYSIKRTENFVINEAYKSVAIYNFYQQKEKQMNANSQSRYAAELLLLNVFAVRRVSTQYVKITFSLQVLKYLPHRKSLKEKLHFLMRSMFLLYNLVMYKLFVRGNINEINDKFEFSFM
jgi:hypothetical protein